MKTYYAARAAEVIAAHAAKAAAPAPYVAERRHSARKGVVGILCSRKSMWNGPTSLLNINYGPGHLRRADAIAIANSAVASFQK